MLCNSLQHEWSLLSLLYFTSCLLVMASKEQLTQLLCLCHYWPVTLSKLTHYSIWLTSWLAAISHQTPALLTAVSRLSHKSESESYVTTDGQSASLVLTTRFLLLSDSCRFVDVGRSLWREDGSVIYNCCWPMPVQSFSCLSPMGLATIFYCLRFETLLFATSYDSQGYDGGIWPCLPLLIM
jgi:hypothetical protein